MPKFIVLTVFLVSLISLPSYGQSWENLPGKATAIAAGGDSTVSVWVLGQGGKAYRWSEASLSWQDFGGEADLIAVTSSGRPWVVQNKKIYRLRGQAWQRMPGKAEGIAAGGGSVWILGDRGSALKWNETTFGWEDHGGEAEFIAVTSDGRPWVIEDKQIYRLRGQTWQHMPGKAREVAAGGGTVWAIGEDNEIYKWDEESFSWQNFGGKADNIAITPEGRPWVTEDGFSGQKIYRLK